MNFVDFYILDERNKHQDAYLPIKDKIAKYKDDDDIYISFTEIDKLGINPKTKYNTPAGIYTYPVKASWEPYFRNWQVPFQGDVKYVQILRHTRRGKYIEDISNLGQREFKDNLDKLEKFFKDIYIKKLKKEGTYGDVAIKTLDKIFLALLKKTEANSNNKSYGGILFYFVYNIAEKMKNYLPTKSLTTGLTYIWRKVLGYNMIADKSGKGIIHPDEKIQAVFFDKESYEHIDTLMNKEYELLSQSKIDFKKNAKEDLRVTEFNDGTPIPLVTDKEEWKKLKTPAMCYYNNDSSTGIALYNWYAVDTGKLAPKGWHVPTDEEMKLSMDVYYKSLNLKYNGFRNKDGDFNNQSHDGYWWSATENGASYAWYRNLYYGFENLSRTNYYKSCGFSVRLLRD